MSEPTHHLDHARREENHRHEGHGADHHHEGHGAHGGHAHGGHAHGDHPQKTTWRTAASATLHCLTGCAIGEVLGLVIGTALGWSTAPTIVLAVALAFFFGYLLTLIPLRRAGVDWGTAIKLALAADTVSIIVMEVVDNGVMLVIPGAMDAGLTSGLFWGALAFAFLVAFLVTTPVNKWIIGRGKGHAVVHAYHH
ncbi:hypothetical protein GCM10010156_61740 [Planobispora rosea]|uniref:DUF4396 domain-containing protein n=1 Tax=Planobispora rosea TaxID=35762 RepID=A0A8J3S7D9_PLARO|nr:DUF4396 domain-containing protein [Planobispora rosea]GGS95098.1 hypothetical protein GCM10010156_61740 [Planobispora rosea]GIH87475.1 hypothetical protein Pro02_58830 [Planobispora rosea]